MTSSDLEANLLGLKDLFNKIIETYQTYTTKDQFYHTHSWFYAPELSIPPSENEKSQNYRSQSVLQNKLQTSETKLQQNISLDQKDTIEREINTNRRDVDLLQAEKEAEIQKEWENLVQERTAQYQNFIQMSLIRKQPLEGYEKIQQQEGVKKYRQDVIDFVRKLDFNKIDQNDGKLKIIEAPVPGFINGGYKSQNHAIEPVDVTGHLK